MPVDAFQAVSIKNVPATTRNGVHIIIGAGADLPVNGSYSMSPICQSSFRAVDNPMIKAAINAKMTTMYHARPRPNHTS